MKKEKTIDVNSAVAIMLSTVFKTLLDTNAHKATKYLTDKKIVRAVRRMYTDNGKKSFSKSKIEITLTIGKPNFKEREFIKLCKKAGETLPLRDIQLAYLPKKKK